MERKLMNTKNVVLMGMFGALAATLIGVRSPLAAVVSPAASVPAVSVPASV